MPLIDDLPVTNGDVPMAMQQIIRGHPHQNGKSCIEMPIQPAKPHTPTKMTVEGTKHVADALPIQG
jgi:hypothetical protein